ncbi:MAG TPA: CvpA family protein [Chloroflexota bacterium]|nr:CvpA family protein [Chloroflexota bacterium]
MNDPALPDLGSQILSFLGGYNPVDVVLVLFFALYALDGLRRGFIAGALGLIGIFLTLALAVQGYQPAAETLTRSANLPPLLANIVGFFLVLVLAQLAIAVITRFVLVALVPIKFVLGPLALVDNLLGILPGLAQAALIAALVLTPFQTFPFFAPVTATIDGSVLAREITSRVAAITPQMEALLRQSPTA